MNLITNYGADFALFTRTIATIIIVWQIIPLQIKENKIKNGLRRLRAELLIMDFTLLITNLLSMLLIITSKGFIPINSVILQVVNSVAILVFAIVLYLIYNEQYTPESKEIHRRVDAQIKWKKSQGV